MAIALSAGVRTNLQSLQNIASLLNTSQNRLATGKKVNSALDSPTAFFTATGLTDRSSTITGLLDGVNNGISTIQAASRGLDSIYKSIQTAQGLIDKAKSDAGTVSNQVTGAVTTLTASTTLTSLGYADNDNVTFTDNVTGAATSVDLGTIGSQTVQDLIDTINAQGNGVYTASLSNGALRVNGQGDNAFTVTGTTGAAITATFGATVASTVNGTYDQNKLNSYAVQFNELLDSIDQFASDASFNGVNLLKAGNNLTVNYNADGSSSTTINSKEITATNFGLADISTTASSLTDFTSRIALLKTAASDVRQIQGEYTSKLSIMQNRVEFSKSLTDILQTGADNLTLADPNEEAANVLALQTRQQLSQSALSLSVQADQSVLQLLR